MRRIPLGYLFLLPAGTAILLFFFLPVILTFVYSFTNMGSDTGVYGGNRYVFSDHSFSKLETSMLSLEILSQITEKKYVFDDRTLNSLRQSNIRKKTLREIEKKLAGKTYLSEKDLFNDLKRLKYKPRAFRDKKKISKAAARSLQDREFHTEEELRAAFERLGIVVGPEEMETILEYTNTSWHWTLRNYRELFANPDSWRIFTNTGLYVITTLCLFNIGLALVLALITFYMPTGTSKLFRALWLIPRITPSVLYVLLWRGLMDHEGFISYVVGFFGVSPTNWMGEFPWLTIILINGFVGTSMGMIIFSSAMQTIPKSLLHAAAVDGAYIWQQIRRVILPQLRWPILFMASYQTLSLLTSFEYIQLSTDGGPARATEVWALYSFHTALSNYYGNLRYGFGATLAVVLVVIGIIASLLYLKFFKFSQLLSEPMIED